MNHRPATASGATCTGDGVHVMACMFSFSCDGLHVADDETLVQMYDKLICLQ
jgi:hypothetical protein